MVKHAANGQSPLLNAGERVQRAFKGIVASDSFTPEQLKWLERIRTPDTSRTKTQCFLRKRLWTSVS